MTGNWRLWIFGTIAAAALRCAGGETEIIGEIDADADADGDSDADVDTETDTDAPGGDCAPRTTLELGVGQGAFVETDLGECGDQLPLACEEVPQGADWVVGLSLEDPGGLAVTLRSEDHLAALYDAQGLEEGECPTEALALGCYDSYYDGRNLLFAIAQAGEYLLVLSEWSPGAAVPLGVPVILYAEGAEICDNAVSDDGDSDVDCEDADCAGLALCAAEVCDDGEDDNWNGAGDCLEPTCVGTPQCTGANCEVDVDLGALAMNQALAVAFDTAVCEHDRFRMPCTPVPDTVEHVIGFELVAPALVSIDFAQAAQGDHCLGFFFEGGPSAGCVDFMAECHGDGLAETVKGALLADGQVLPPGRYFLVVEVNGAAGPVDMVLEAAPVCPEGYVWDSVDAACEEWPCPAVDLGTWDGTPMERAVDTCAGEALFGGDDSACTGWTAKAEEVVVSLIVPDGDTIEVELVPGAASDMDASLYILEDCGDFDRSTCLAGSDIAVEGGAESVDYTNDTGADRTVFIFADAYSGCATASLFLE